MSIKTKCSSVDNVLAFTFSDIQKLQDFYSFPVTALRSAQSEIDNQIEYIYRLEAIITRQEDEIRQLKDIVKDTNGPIKDYCL